MRLESLTAEWRLLLACAAQGRIGRRPGPSRRRPRLAGSDRSGRPARAGASSARDAPATSLASPLALRRRSSPGSRSSTSGTRAATPAGSRSSPRSVRGSAERGFPSSSSREPRSAASSIGTRPSGRWATWTSSPDGRISPRRVASCAGSATPRTNPGARRRGTRRTITTLPRWWRRTGPSSSSFTARSSGRRGARSGRRTVGAGQPRANRRREIPRPRPDDLLLHLCLHLAHDNVFIDGKLRDLRDMAETIRHYGDAIGWDAVVGQAKTWQVSRYVYWSLWLARDQFGAAVPPVVLERLADAHRARRSDALLRRLLPALMLRPGRWPFKLPPWLMVGMVPLLIHPTLRAIRSACSHAAPAGGDGSPRGTCVARWSAGHGSGGPRAARRLLSRGPPLRHVAARWRTAAGMRLPDDRRGGQGTPGGSGHPAGGGATPVRGGAPDARPRRARAARARQLPGERPAAWAVSFLRGRRQLRGLVHAGRVPRGARGAARGRPGAAGDPLRGRARARGVRRSTGSSRNRSRGGPLRTAGRDGLRIRGGREPERAPPRHCGGAVPERRRRRRVRARPVPRRPRRESSSSPAPATATRTTTRPTSGSSATEPPWSGRSNPKTRTRSACTRPCWAATWARASRRPRASP